VKVRLFIVAVWLGAIVGCATSGKFAAQMDSWVGGDINSAIGQFGPPSNTYTLPNGSVMYTWLWVGNSVVTTNYNEYVGLVTTARTPWCRVSFTASGSRIDTWRADGNRCRSK
jgi:hypothetical protein